MKKAKNFGYNILKFFFYKWRSFSNSICNGKIFDGVEFKNSAFISIGLSSNIERGSVVKVLVSGNIHGKNIIVKNYCWIGKNVEIDATSDDKIIINDYVSIQDRCKILGSIYIGKYCILAPDIFMSSGNHHYKENPFFTIRQQDNENNHLIKHSLSSSNSIIIEEDCWIGKNVFIAPGVNIGRGAVIGTNSIVKNHIEPYSVNIGSPTKKVKERIYFNPSREVSSFKAENLPYFYRGFQHYVPNKNIIDVIKDNKGILSENKSLVLLEKSLWEEAFVKGVVINDGLLKIYIDGIQYVDIVVGKHSDFEYKFYKKDINHFNEDNFWDLPAILKKYCCLQFEFKPNDKSNQYNFIISNISIK